MGSPSRQLSCQPNWLAPSAACRRRSERRARSRITNDERVESGLCLPVHKSARPARRTRQSTRGHTHPQQTAPVRLESRDEHRHVVLRHGAVQRGEGASASVLPDTRHAIQRRELAKEKQWLRKGDAQVVNEHHLRPRQGDAPLPQKPPLLVHCERVVEPRALGAEADVVERALPRASRGVDLEVGGEACRGGSGVLRRCWRDAMCPRSRARSRPSAHRWGGASRTS